MSIIKDVGTDHHVLVSLGLAGPYWGCLIVLNLKEERSLICPLFSFSVFENSWSQDLLVKNGGRAFLFKYFYSETLKATYLVKNILWRDDQ
jgi:hypothetical protein